MLSLSRYAYVYGIAVNTMQYIEYECVCFKRDNPNYYKLVACGSLPFVCAVRGIYQLIIRLQFSSKF